MNPSQHLPPELLFGYEHGLLSPEELREVHEHTAACAACREEAAARLDIAGMTGDLRAALALDSRPGFGRLLPYAAAAALLLAAGGSIWMVRRGQTQTVAARRAPSDPPAVRAALKAGRIPLPGFLERLAPGREVLMGPSPSAPERSLAPAATGVLEVAPRFRWEPLPGDWTYQVLVFRLDGEPVASSPQLASAEWVSDHDLPPGADYAWQVVATRGAERVTLPEPPATPPKFRVLDAATSGRLRDLKKQQPDSHLLLGVEYARAGATDEARAQLGEALRHDPGREDLRRLLASLAEPSH